MYVAQKKRRENIVEYLLYMWQVEDLIRAAGVSTEGVERLILPRYQGSEEELATIRSWYEELIDMMRIEGKQKEGHLDVHRVILMELEELHRRFASNPDDYIYAGLQFQILPALIQLRAKGGEGAGDIETCLNALYGYITLSLQGKEVSPETQKSMKQISALLAMLAHRYHLEHEAETAPQRETK
jgi:hypothetical protein